MHLMNGSSLTTTWTGFNPREGREMHRIHMKLTERNSMCFNPREGREMHPEKLRYAVACASFQSP